MELKLRSVAPHIGVAFTVLKLIKEFRQARDTLKREEPKAIGAESDGVCEHLLVISVIDKFGLVA